MINDPRYEMVIYWSDQDEAFVVEVPELPGCMADGVAYQEAVRNARTIIAEWIERARGARAADLGAAWAADVRLSQGRA